MNNSDAADSHTVSADVKGRRDFLTTAVLANATAALSSVPLAGAQSQATFTTTGRGSSSKLGGRRKLGSLEVSSVGLGVQNMSRKYETTVPYRPEMINIIRAAYDRCVTFFDTAEAYGPFECERIPGEKHRTIGPAIWTAGISRVGTLPASGRTTATCNGMRSTSMEGFLMVQRILRTQNPTQGTNQSGRRHNSAG